MVSNDDKGFDLHLNALAERWFEKQL